MKSISMLSLSCVIVACGAPAAGRVDTSQWTQCPPVGVEPQDCTYSFIHLDGSGGDLNTQLQELCNTPCFAIEKLQITDLDIQSLGELVPLQHITSVGSLLIERNNQLIDLTGLERISKLAGLEVDSNQALTSLRGLDNMSDVVVLEIENNPALTEIGGLSTLTHVQKINVQLNPKLVNIDSFRNVAAVDEFSLSGTAVTSIDIMDGVESMSLLGITDNPNLLRLGGFAKMAKVDSIYVSNNPQLPDCEAAAFAERVGARHTDLSDNNPNGECTAP